MRHVRALLALAVTVGYFFYVFQIPRDSFWQLGIGDWGDPYFINFLLEHWYNSATRLTDPASPPMYFPVKGTLGYSHGLILYAPVYIAARSVLDPFQAHNITLLLILVSGSVSLYLILREIVGLRFIEALLLTVFFCSSRNVVNPATSIWSQTASVFLIPPILLMACAAARMSAGPGRRGLAGLAGLLLTLLFTQEFYTAQFALLFVSTAIAAWLIVEKHAAVSEWIADLWRQERRVDVWIAAVVAVVAAVWTVGLLTCGGGVITLHGFRFSSREWRRPALLALVALGVLLYRRGGPRLEIELGRARQWVQPFSVGAALGCCVFLWVYLPSIFEHAGFSDDQLMLTPHDASRWPGLNFVRALGVYDSLRPFYFAFLMGGLACLPWVRLDRKVRVYCGCFLLLSLIVLVVPVRFGTFSIWTTFFVPFPGFSAIRDPRRIIQVYELFLVLLAALLMIRLPRRSRFRFLASTILIVLLVTDWNREVFVFGRPTTDYRRWVDAAIDVDPACKSFFIKDASERYTSRWNYFRILFSVDAMFVSLKYSIPTLNGYSGWNPAEWRMFQPRDPDYPLAVAQWIERHHLTGVCEFDIERRTMRPWGRQPSLSFQAKAAPPKRFALCSGETRRRAVPVHTRASAGQASLQLHIMRDKRRSGLNGSICRGECSCRHRRPRSYSAISCLASARAGYWEGSRPTFARSGFVWLTAG
jgi:hypothetical protein